MVLTSQFSLSLIIPFAPTFIPLHGTRLTFFPPLPSPWCNFPPALHCKLSSPRQTVLHTNMTLKSNMWELPTTFLVLHTWTCVSIIKLVASGCQCHMSYVAIGVICGKITINSLLPLKRPHPLLSRKAIHLSSFCLTSSTSALDLGD